MVLPLCFFPQKMFTECFSNMQVQTMRAMHITLWKAIHIQWKQLQEIVSKIASTIYSFQSIFGVLVRKHIAAFFTCLTKNVYGSK